MKIKNKTRYNGVDIRGLFLACAKHEGVVLGDHSRLVVEIGPYRATSKRRCRAAYFGRPYLSGTIDIIRPHRLRKDIVSQLGSVATGTGCQVPAEMLAAICDCVRWLVLTHAGDANPDSISELPAWAEGRTVRIKPEPSKPNRLTGLAYHQAELAKDEAKAAKWEAEVRARERKAAAAEKQAKKARSAVLRRKTAIRRLEKS